ncbi:MAG: hypothetical protein KY455_01400 [Euryarchaeota archaeon]|nr:hypothetical protein [Euryarchaeota archaeon]
MVPGAPRRTWTFLAFAVVASMLLFAVGPAFAGNHQDKGQGRFRVDAFTEVQVTDGTISPITVDPTTSDPGPRAFDNMDRFRFNTRYTNTRHVLFLDVPSAQTGQGASSLTVQGVSHQVADWIHIRQGGASAFVTVERQGVYDSDAVSYTAPGGATQSSQGTVVFRSYDKTSPSDGGTTSTWYWIYDAGQNRYWFDPTDKDFTNGNGEVSVWPISKSSATHYVFTHGTNTFGVSGVAGSATDYVPTVRLGWLDRPGPGGGHDHDAYVLVDFASGTPADTYSYSVQGTIYDTV